MQILANMPDFASLVQDFVGLLNPAGAASSADTNATVAANGDAPHFELPITVLETFIPGYSLIRKILLDIFGIDISILVSIIGFAFVLRTASTYTWDFASEILASYFTVNIDMGENDDPFEPLMQFLVQNGHTKKARSLKAAGRWWGNMMDSKRSLLEMNEKIHGTSASAAIYNNRTIESKRPMGYEPDQGNYRFWHKGRLYFLSLYMKTYQYRHDEYVRLTVSTLGWSAEPLKQFLEEVRAQEKDTEAETDFFRADPQDSDWRCVASRPTRSLNTVALETADKLRLVRDINDYIHPSRAKWYSSRGIPYRRGYLFSGPPGTGKTSLSLALAGVFGLGLYALSLQDSGMTEERLTQLFDYLPERCVVLLEDIDSAGLGEQRLAEASNTSVQSAKPALGNDRDSSSSQEAGKPEDKKAKAAGISLAGLLNAIDGVASHEGHVLIMTTNHPEKLDAALKRPGRVDMHIAFTLATKFQAREIFLRMFTDEVEPHSHITTTDEKSLHRTKSIGPQVQTVADVCRERSELADSRTCPFMSLIALDELADQFVEQLPGQVFSPAEIQGFLLLYKTDPVRAVKDLQRWMEETGKLRTVDAAEVGLEKEEKEDSRKVKVKRRASDDEGSGVEVEEADGVMESKAGAIESS